MKTHVVCIDGTGNHPLQTDADLMDPIESKTETNVFRMFRFLTGQDKNTQPQIHQTHPLAPPGGRNDDPGMVLYLAGVGSTGGFVANRLDGGTGYGTMNRILEGYRFLADQHRPGDRIFGFGFSRGAFAVRSLAGLIDRVGLPAAPRFLDDNELRAIGEAYLKAANVPSPLPTHRKANIDFLGLWDTVGALRGIETAYLHDVSPANVLCAAHALALDEEREQFTPEYWDASRVHDGIEEVWFAGAHSNVGGGYVNPELSNVALAWVVSKAVGARLVTQPGYINGWYTENSFGRYRDSHREFLRGLRAIGAFVKGRRRARAIRVGQGVHKSVFDRIGELPSDYSTGGLTKPNNWQPYAPAARLDGGQPLPATGAAFTTGTVFETPDYDLKPDPNLDERADDGQSDVS